MDELGIWIHICVDMQRLFHEDTPWHVPWMRRALPQVAAVADFRPERTIFTRFLPPDSAEQAVGAWKDYYRKWWMMTGEHLPRERLHLVAELAAMVPPARVFDKRIYSPWLTGGLHAVLSSEGVSTIAVTGGETDVCVLATVTGAIDLGYRVIVLRDAVCSGDDESYDAALELFERRFSTQLQLMSSDEFLARAARQVD
ncbi:cysteine hydrolase family protein [Mycoplana dimorpha]|uniref:Nicotinamidase-related amidase n=1 Tax=Mycoplana dimorpha TaxID=28320 RepID=A0A2T5B5A0_MYCDI|nr:cysteine hydrolase [Mycoplana dimorpha]PTM94165.1 nicotinamidase-related amidase [Mycoplana dimorpha]